MGLILCVSVFAGCSLVERNNEKYLNATVATIEYDSGKVEKITKQELLTAYNSYGYYYVQNGSTMQEAVDMTIDSIVDRKLTVKAVEDYYKNSSEEELTASEKTYLWDQTYSSMYKNLKTYFDKINDTPALSEEEEDESANASVYVPFESSVYLAYEDVVDDNGTADTADDETISKLVIMKDSISSSVRQSYEARSLNGKTVDFEYEEDGKYPFKEALYNKIKSTSEGNTEGAKTWKSAIDNYIEDVEENYDYKKFNSSKDVLLFEIERIYDILKENYYVEKYSDIYNGQQYNFKSNITVDDLLSAYSKSVSQSFTKYMREGGAFETDILSDISKIDYIKDGSNYFYLSYIKFDIDTAELTKLETEYNQKKFDGAQYKAKVDAVYNNAYATIRDSKTGETTVNTVLAKTLADKISGELDKEYWTVERLNNSSAESVAEKANAVELGLTDEMYVEKLNKQIAYEKAEVLRPYLYLYNADDTYKGAEYNAVFGADNAGKILAGEKFAENQDVLNAIKSLYNGGDVKVGDMSELVRVENDGVYLFFYAGAVENVFSDIDENFDITRSPEAIKKLAETRINIFSEKTIFDQLYSEATKDYYSVFETLNMNKLRGMTKNIEIIENELKDLY